MTSICMPPQSASSYQHFQLTNGNIMLLHQHQQQQQQQQQQAAAAYGKQHQLIAPKMPLGNSQLQNMQQQQQQQSSAGGIGPMMLPKKKFNYANMPYGEQMPSVARRNARERNRVKQVNNGFVNLRQHLPQTVINSLSNGGRGASKKLSKVDTLRIALEYIRGLQDMLDDGQPRSQLYSCPDESSNDGSYDYSSMDSPQQYGSGAINAQAHSYHSASPTPSYSDSDLSASACASYVKVEPLEPEPQHQPEFKFESFDSFSDEQPDDEELLDYISSWQEQ